MAMLETLFYFGNQFFGIERLGYVVIAFQVEPFQTVYLFSAVGEEEDKYAQVTLTDKPRQLETVHQRHIDVKQHQVRTTGGVHLPSCTSILGIVHFIALHLQELP